MFTLAASQHAVLDQLSNIAKARHLGESDIEEHDEDMIEQLFRMKILTRLPKRPRDPQRYLLDVSKVFSTDLEVLIQQNECINVDTLILLDDLDAKVAHRMKAWQKPTTKQSTRFKYSDDMEETRAGVRHLMGTDCMA
jgi:hypothetical protein